MFVPQIYDLFLELDPRRDTFRGKVRVKGSGGPIVLDAVGMKILRASAPFRYDGKRLHIEAEDEVEVEFEGRFWDDLLGPYKTGGAIVTQFEENYARRMFPCVDDPRYKARFRVIVKAPKALTVIFNTLPEEEGEEGEWKVVRFKETPPMPTYLLFFGVGPFQGKEMGRIRVFVLGAKIDDAEVAGKLAKESLETLERLLSVPYPLEKLDLVSVPEFLFGAMENWGAMVFRESAMLYNERLPTRLLWRVAEVVAHETVHQWFGNLVTPKSWRDIWLNESFATYLSTLITPSVDLSHVRTSNIVDGLLRDSLPSTIPIELEGGGENVITPNTSPIIYSKGASILQMLHSYLGEGFFRVLSDYLKKFAYGNASTDDFFAVLASHWKLAKEFRETWIRRAGHPVILVENGEGEVRTFSFFGTKEGDWFIPLRVKGKPIIYRGGELDGYPEPGPFRVYFDELPEVREEHAWKAVDDYFAFAVEGTVTLREYREVAERFLNGRYDFLSVLVEKETVLWRLGLGNGGLSLLRKVNPKGGGARELVLSRRIQLGDRRAIKVGEELWENPGDGDDYSIGLNAYFRGGGDPREPLKEATHEGEERTILEAAAANMDPFELVEVLEELPKAKRLYPMRALVKNPLFDPDYWLREELERVKELLLPRHLEYVLLRWVPLSRLSLEEALEVMDRAGKLSVRDYVIDLTRAYRRLLSA